MGGREGEVVVLRAEGRLLGLKEARKGKPGSGETGTKEAGFWFWAMRGGKEAVVLSGRRKRRREGGLARCRHQGRLGRR